MLCKCGEVTSGWMIYAKGGYEEYQDHFEADNLNDAIFFFDEFCTKSNRMVDGIGPFSHIVLHQSNYCDTCEQKDRTKIIKQFDQVVIEIKKECLYCGREEYEYYPESDQSMREKVLARELFKKICSPCYGTKQHTSCICHQCDGWCCDQCNDELYDCEGIQYSKLDEKKLDRYDAYDPNLGITSYVYHEILDEHNDWR